MAGLTLRSVQKNYGEVPVIKGVDLDIAHGEFVVFVGPSGCGKSTLLRMIAGLEDISGGEITIGDRLVNEVEPRDRGVAMVFQSYALYPHMSVYDNVGFGLKLSGTPKDVRDRKIRDAARVLQMEHLLDRRPAQLSGGQRQRVAIGRAIVRQPDVFLFDEPLSNLDAALRGDMRMELARLHHDLDATMVYVTHDQVEAMSMSHRIAVMHQGVLQQVDTPLNIYNHPQTLFVATFIGSPPINIIECQLDGATLRATSCNFQYPAPAGLTAREVYFGIRAEDVQIIVNNSAPADLQGEIIVREPLGDETIYIVQAGDCRISVKTPPKVILNPGEIVGLKLNPERIHLFDKATEQSLRVAQAK
jgi:multiple sugar transport system ATP-binding protein